MKMDRRERKYVSWTLAGSDPGMAFEISLDNVTWTPVTLVGGVVTVLLRGPDAPAYVGSADVPLGTSVVRFRATDNPEIEIDKAGSITCE